MQQLVSHTPEKDKLAPLLSTLTSHLPSENPDREGLQNQFDELTSRWSDLTDHLGQCQSNLDSTLALAKNYEGAADKLLPWVPDTLNRLENLGPPPAEPEAVEKLKSEIEVGSIHYNRQWNSFWNFLQIPYSGKFLPGVNLCLFRHASQVAKIKLAKIKLAKI